MKIRGLEIPRRLFKAYLAEDYDGIGQYVLTTMARTSTSAAVRARIAAGDFGGGRKFPAGTPVVVFSNRGQLEILGLGNQPALCTEDFRGGFAGELPSLDGWRFENGLPGNDWYREGDSEYFSVVGGQLVIASGAYSPSTGVDTDPWIWMFPKGDPTTYKFPAEYLIRFKVEFTGVPDTQYPQIDFYLGDVEKVGTAGSLGDVFFATLEGPISAPNFRLGSFGMTDYSTSIESNPGTSIWNNWALLKWSVDPAASLAKAKLWVDGTAEPDWMSTINILNFSAWNGLRILIVGPYSVLIPGPPSGDAYDIKYRIDYIKDLKKGICKMNGTDFVPTWNGPL